MSVFGKTCRRRRHDKKGCRVMQCKSCCHTIDKTAARQIDTNSTYLVAYEAEKENERVSIESCRGYEQTG
jgi:hypothetical protein